MHAVFFPERYAWLSPKYSYIECLNLVVFILENA